MLVVELHGPTMFVRIDIMRYRVREFNAKQGLCRSQG